MAKRKILFLAASPWDQGKLRLGEEAKRIEQALKATTYRDDFEVITKWAVTIDDTRRALSEERPAIVHYCGHGGPSGELCFEDEEGRTHEIKVAAISNLFKLFAGTVECVFLNCCYSEMQAKEIVKHIPFVIGMTREIGDAAAIKFSSTFYESLGDNHTYEEAYELSRVTLQAHNMDADLDSRLFVLQKAKIELPRTGTTVNTGIVRVCGRIDKDFTRKLYLLTGGPDRYWPSACIVPSTVDGKWEGQVHVGSRWPSATIRLVAVDQICADYIEFYRANAGSLGHSGMKITELPAKLDEVRLEIDLIPLRDRLIGLYEVFAGTSGVGTGETVSITLDGKWGLRMICQQNGSQRWVSVILMDDGDA